MGSIVARLPANFQPGVVTYLDVIVFAHDYPGVCRSESGAVSLLGRATNIGGAYLFQVTNIERSNVYTGVCLQELAIAGHRRYQGCYPGDIYVQ